MSNGRVDLDYEVACLLKLSIIKSSTIINSNVNLIIIFIIIIKRSPLSWQKALSPLANNCLANLLNGHNLSIIAS